MKTLLLKEQTKVSAISNNCVAEFQSQPPRSRV